MLGSEAQVIQQLRVHGAGLDPLLTRLRAYHLLSMVDFSPSRLSPAAVLCIRTLRDPLPGTLHLDNAQAFPDRTWQSAVHDEMNRLAESAARPIAGSVPANAQSVLFADRAEMLACLARDWQRGQLGQQWWWRGLLRGDLPAAALEMWHGSPEYVPVTLVRLDRAAGPFLEALPASDVQRLIEAVIMRYDLAALKSALAAMPTSRSDTAPVTPVMTPPWRVFLPESRAISLSPVRELLLGVALAVVQQPSLVRSEPFAQAAQIWLVARASVAASPDSPITHASIHDQTRDAPEPSLSGTPAPRTDAMPPPLPRAEQTLERMSQWRYDDAIEEKSSAVVPPESIETSDVPATPETDETEMPLDSLPENLLITSQFGGVFYLLNALIAIGLYGDFTMPRPSGLALSPWDVLALMGAHFIGAAFQADPIWPLLAHLSGRGDAAPGHDFAAPDAWHIDPIWLEPFDETKGMILSRDEGRLRVWHRAGFWLIDAAEGGPPAEAIEGIVPAPPADALTRWCAWLAAYLRARLRVALDLEDDSALVPTLFAHAAQIAITPARVDITLNLTTLPIAIRYAGLDRDPGWIPAAGRTVAFRFEV